MKNIISNKYFLLLARLILGFVFIYAGTQKISNPESFVLAITNYKLLPNWIVNFLAITLPWLELVIGILILFGYSIKENAAIIFSLLMIFNMAILISLVRGLNIDCGCFGNGTQIGILKLSENFVMVLLSICLILFESITLNWNHLN